MRRGNGTLTHEPATLPPTVAYRVQRVDALLQFAAGLLLLGSVLVQAVVVAPVLVDVSAALTAERQTLTEQERTLGEMRARAIQQQAAILAQQERLKRDAEANLRLAAEIRKTLTRE